MTAAPDGRIITFYSYKGGTGRTMALANVAWILAANGKRVLAADWDLESPGLHRYFHPFLTEGTLTEATGVIDMVNDYQWAATEDRDRPADWYRDFARVGRHVVSLSVDGMGLRFPEGGALDFLSAGRQDGAYSMTVSSFSWDDFYDRLGGGRFLDALRDDMKASYDYVLIDSRTGLSDIADICTVQLPDVLVDCFTLSDQAISGAAKVAHSITARYRNRAIRVLPVPMRIDDGEKEKADAGRALARLRFEGLPTAADGGRLTAQETSAYWHRVEVPYRAYYAYEEVLATFADESGATGSLLAAYERLTAVITDGEIDSLPPMPKSVRLRGHDRFVRRRPVPRQQVAVVFAPEDLMWAEWVEATLMRAGCRVTRCDLSTGPVERTGETTHTAVLMSRAALDSRYTDTFLSTLSGSAVSSYGPVLVLRVDGVRLPSYRDDHPQLDLHRLGEEQCRAALLRGFDLPADPDDENPVPERFPGLAPRVWNAPPRNAMFTGRDAQLARMRAEFAVDMNGIQALVGLGGVGKTQLALEYAYRFMADYDLVWWISAERPEGVTAALAELGSRLGPVGGEDMTRTAQDTVRLLSAEDRPFARWLLVFDHADAPAEIRDRIPVRGGHVLVTSHRQEWLSHSASVPVEVFLREESVRLLTRRVPGLAHEEADAVASAVGDLPLAVEQASAWLAETATPVDMYLEQLTAQLADFPGSVTATWNLSIDRLRERSPGAARLLELCAFFSAEPISTSLLYTAEMLEALKPYDPSLQEKLLIGRLLREISRFSLAVIDPAGGTVQVHRLLQEAMRTQLDEERRQEARHVVHRLLAAARPDADEPVDDPETWPRFETIWPHLWAAGVRDAELPQARRLLIDRVRYLEKRGLLSQARRLAEDLLTHWSHLLGEDDVQYLYLRGRLADVLRSEGRFAEARDLDEDLLERQRAVLGPTHPHTYVTMSGLARDQAALGDYDTALVLARAAHEGFEDIFWAFHPRTTAAAADLALALRAVGRYEEARALDEQTLNHRTETLGSDHPATLASAESLGTDLRAAGRYVESTELLRRTYETYRRVLGEDFPGTLRCARSLAVSMRWMNEIQQAKRLTEETLARYGALYESPTPESLACELSLAVDLYTVEEKEAARELGTLTLGKYQRTMGTGHPYTLTAEHNLALLHRGCGDVELAELVFTRVLGQLSQTLGERHPYTLFCTANLANTLAEQGRYEEADALETRATDGLRETLGPRHPEYLATLANRALTLTALGRDEEAVRLRSEVAERLLTLSVQETRLARAVRDQHRFSRSLVPMAS